MLKILRIKNIIGFLLIFVIIGGLSYMASYVINHKDNVLYFKGETVTWHGEQVSSIVVDEGEIIELPTINKVGYDFLGWFYDDAFSKPCGDSIIGRKGSTTIFPYLKLKEYTVYLKYLNSDNPTENIATYGHTFSLYNNVDSHFGYRVTWIDTNTNEEVVGSIIVTSNLSFEQIEIPNVYTLNYLDYNRNIKLSKEFVYNENKQQIYVDEDIAQIEGYSLSGWYYYNKLNTKVTINPGEYLNEDMVRTSNSKNEISIYGKYDLNSYLLIFADEDENEIKSTSIEYGKEISRVLDTEKDDEALQRDHQKIIGFKYCDSTEINDFTNIKMPANNLVIQPIYDYDKYKITVMANFVDNLVTVDETIIINYGSALLSEDLPTSEDVENAVENYQDWKGYTKFNEYDLNYFTIDENETEYDFQDVLTMLQFIDNDKVITYNYRKERFYLEYYKEPELVNLYKRVAITDEDEFVVEPEFEIDNDAVVFGGWVFADDDRILLEYDSFDLINVGKDVKIYADLYNYDLDFWRFEEVNDKWNVIKYVGGYENVIVPAQYFGDVYAIGDGQNSILRSGVSSNVKRILIPESIKVINSKAFYNNDVFVRFYNINGNFTSLTIKEDAFTSQAISGSYSYNSSIGSYVTNIQKTNSISRIKLPTRTEIIEDGAFAGAIDLEYIDVSKNCFNYYSENGILYKKASGSTGKELVAYPASYSSTEYTLPNDVERIAGKAFKINYPEAGIHDQDIASQLKQSTLKIFNVNEDNNLQYIGNSAFYGNYQLMYVNMPKLNLNALGEKIFELCFDNFKPNAYKNDETNEYNYPEMSFDFNNLTYIPESFLSNARYLNKLKLYNYDNVKSLGDYCFHYTGNKVKKSYLGEYNEDESENIEDSIDCYYLFKNNYNIIGNYAFDYSKFYILVNSSFNLIDDTINEVKSMIGKNAFNSMKILYGKANGGLEFNSVNIGYQAFCESEINTSISLVNCVIDNNSSLFYNATIKGDVNINIPSNLPTSCTYCILYQAYIYGDLNIELNNNSIGTYALFKATIGKYNGNILISGGNVTINFINGGSISEYVFANMKCKNLYLKGISSIDYRAFGTLNNSYTNGNIPTSTSCPNYIEFDDETCTLTKLNAYQFACCGALEKIVLSSSITSINGNTFAYEWNWYKYNGETMQYSYYNETASLKQPLKVIIKQKSSPITINGNFYIGISSLESDIGKENSITFYVDESIIANYQSTTYWSELYEKGKVKIIQEL